MKPKIALQVGHVLRLKAASVVVNGGVADLTGPPGRQMIVLVLGVSDTGVPFDVEPMLRALGYVPEKLVAQLSNQVETEKVGEPEEEKADGGH